jgi:hypothetical protein
METASVGGLDYREMGEQLVLVGLSGRILPMIEWNSVSQFLAQRRQTGQ